MKSFYLTFIALLIVVSGYAQYSNSQKGITPKEEYDRAEQYIFEEKFEAAIEIYKKLILERPFDLDLQFKIGFCYLNTSNERYKSIPHLKTVCDDYKKNSADKEVPLDAFYYLGKAYYLNYDFPAAIATYNETKSYTKEKWIIKQVDQEILRCNNAQEIFENPMDMTVTKLGIINSDYSDHSPVLTIDESYMYFTSRRKLSDSAKTTDDGKYFEDIYVYNRNKGIYSKPEPIGAPINTGTHEATCGLSSDGQEMFIFKSEKADDGNIFFSKLNGSAWSEPEKMNDNINTKKRESHASLSYDKKTLYFTSSRKGGFGGMDIYVSQLQEDGTWGPAKNLGPTVNTPFDEEGPYIHPDNKTLYFSSQGHKNMGGFDVFTALKGEGDVWSTPKNLGFPLNTVDNDVFYIPTIDGQRAYYSSQQDGQSDIFIVTLYNENEKNIALVSGFTYDSNVKTFKNNDLRTSGDTTFYENRWMTNDRYYTINNGTIQISTKKTENNQPLVVDSLCKVPFQTSISILNAQNNKFEEVYTPNSQNGKYMFVIRPSGNYVAYYYADKYMYDSKYIVLKSDSSFKKVNYIAEMDTIVIGKTKKVKQTPFDGNSEELNNQTQSELFVLADFLSKNKDLYVDVSTHSFLKNDEPIDTKRKENAINFLTSNGVQRDKILTDLSPNNINANSLEFTVYDEITKKNAELEKEKAIADNNNLIANNNNNNNNQNSNVIKKVEFVDNILFGYSQSTTRSYNKNLEDLANYLKENEEAEIQINGYACPQGNREYNIELAKKRAAFVQEYLIKSGVEQKQVKIVGFTPDEENMISKTRDEKGQFIVNSLPYNRRVEFKVLKNGEKSQLSIIPIDVPEKFRVAQYNIEENYIYSIEIVTSATQISLNQFGSLQNVKELKDSNNNFVYYYGNFKNAREADKELESAKKKYPKAFVFINTL